MTKKYLLPAQIFTLMLVPIVSLADTDRFYIQPFTLAKASDKLVTADFNHDGLNDILTASRTTISLYLQTETGITFEQPTVQFELPGAATGWDVSNTTQGDYLIALVDGKTLRRWMVSDKNNLASETLLTNLDGNLPNGHYPLDFMRDINGDGIEDVIVPAAGQLDLWLASGNEYQSGLTVKSRMWNNTRLQPEDNNLAQSIGQRFVIPGLRVRDLNGDGSNDLISRSQDLLEVFLSQDQGSYNAEPSYVVDYAAIRERVGRVTFDKVDFGNLSGLLAYGYESRLEDINGDNIDDLVVREGEKVSLFLGTRTGMAMEQPQQVLKSSGNLLTVFLRDENEDDKPDLWLARLENISLGNLFVWLALSGSVDIDLFVYPNQGERFASRPSRKITITIKFPSFLNILDNNEATETAVEQQGTPRIIAAAISREAANSRDIVLLKENAIAVFLNRLQESNSTTTFGLKGYNRKKNDYVFDMGKILANPSLGGNSYWQTIDGQTPDIEISIENQPAFDLRNSDIFALNINGDDTDDLMVLNQRDGDSISGYLLLSQ